MIFAIARAGTALAPNLCRAGFQSSRWSRPMPRKDLAARRKYDRERIAKLRREAEAEQKRAEEHLKLADIERLGLAWNCSNNDFGLALLAEQHQRDLVLLYSGRLLRPQGAHSSEGDSQPASGPGGQRRLQRAATG